MENDQIIGIKVDRIKKNCYIYANWQVQDEFKIFEQYETRKGDL